MHLSPRAYKKLSHSEGTIIHVQWALCMPVCAWWVSGGGGEEGMNEKTIAVHWPFMKSSIGLFNGSL